MSLTGIETLPTFTGPRINVESRENGDAPNKEPVEYRSLEARKVPNYLEYCKRVPMDLRKRVENAGVQTILEHSCILLPSEMPTYLGREWLVRCQLVRDPFQFSHAAANLRICATLFYFYNCGNIQGRSISFRQKSF